MSAYLKKPDHTMKLDSSQSIIELGVIKQNSEAVTLNLNKDQQQTFDNVKGTTELVGDKSADQLALQSQSTLPHNAK